MSLKQMSITAYVYWYIMPLKALWPMGTVELFRASSPLHLVAPVCLNEYCEYRFISLHSDCKIFSVYNDYKYVCQESSSHLMHKWNRNIKAYQVVMGFTKHLFPQEQRACGSWENSIWHLLIFVLTGNMIEADVLKRPISVIFFPSV